MKILNECEFLNMKAIEKIEKEYNAKYVMETCGKDDNENWCNFPTAIFYTEKAHPDGSNYFAMYVNPYTSHLMIANGLSAVEGIEFSGICVGDEVFYSRYRHDFRALGNYTVDGGRDYFKYSGPDAKIVKFKVNKDKLEFVDV